METRRATLVFGLGIIMFFIGLSAILGYGQADIVVEPVSPNIIVSPIVETPDIYVEPIVEVTNCDDKDGWTEETVIIRMREREYIWAIRNITAERYNDRLWVVTIEFETSINVVRQYIFDENG